MLPFVLCLTAIAQPNVVLVIVDDLSGDHSTIHGHPDVQTPNIDRLAASGLVYKHCVTQSVCRPTLATLLTGRRPEEHGIHGNFGGSALGSVDTLPKVLDANGYHTRCDGKFWEGDPLEFGFDSKGAPTDQWGDANFVRNGQVETIRFVRDAVAAEEPFFLWWAPQMPHTPHNPPTRYTALFPTSSITVPSWFTGNADAYKLAQQKLLAMNYWMDEGLGHLMGELALLDALDDTIFMVLFDNGYRVGGVSKLSPFESGVSTPLIIKAPGVAPQVSLDVPDARDIAPTILAMCGIEPPAVMTGIDLATEEVPANQFGHSFQQNQNTWQAQKVAEFCRTQDGWKYIRWVKAVSPSNSYGMNEPALSSVPTRAVGKEDLYYLGDDPNELNDLSGTQTAKLAELRGATNAWLVSLNEEPPPPVNQAIIVDNDSDGDSAFVVTGGDWVYVVNPQTTGAYLSDVSYSTAGSGADKATWTVSGLDPQKTYRVATTWNPTSNRATNSPFAIYNDDTLLTSVAVNQQIAPGDFSDAGQPWKTLSNVQVSSGVLKVTLTDSANGYVIADAIHVVEAAP